MLIGIVGSNSLLLPVYTGITSTARARAVRAPCYYRVWYHHIMVSLFARSLEDQDIVISISDEGNSSRKWHVEHN